MLTIDQCKRIVERFKRDPNFTMPALLEHAIDELIQRAEEQKEAA